MLGIERDKIFEYLYRSKITWDSYRSQFKIVFFWPFKQYNQICCCPTIIKLWHFSSNTIPQEYFLGIRSLFFFLSWETATIVSATIDLATIVSGTAAKKYISSASQAEDNKYQAMLCSVYFYAIKYLPFQCFEKWVGIKLRRL